MTIRRIRDWRLIYGKVPNEIKVLKNMRSRTLGIDEEWKNQQPLLWQVRCSDS